MKNIYWGAPLFDLMQREFNEEKVSVLREVFKNEISIYSPMENPAINDKNNYADSVMIAEGDNEQLKKSDVLIAILDGPTPDAGLCSEIGYFARMAETDSKKRIIALYSDIRQGNATEQKVWDLNNKVAASQFSYVNLYTIGLCEKTGVVVQTFGELILELQKYLQEKGEY